MYVCNNAKKRFEDILEKNIRAPPRDVVRGSYFFSCLRTVLLRLLVSVPKTSSYLLFSLSLGPPLSDDDGEIIGCLDCYFLICWFIHVGRLNFLSTIVLFCKFPIN